jgi:hypothetical protein
MDHVTANLQKENNTLVKQNNLLRRRLDNAIEFPHVRKPLHELSAGRARERLDMVQKQCALFHDKFKEAYKISDAQLSTILGEWEKPPAAPAPDCSPEHRLMLLLRVCDEHGVGMETVGRLLSALCIDGMTPSQLRKQRDLLTGCIILLCFLVLASLTCALCRRSAAARQVSYCGRPARR